MPHATLFAILFALFFLAPLQSDGKEKKFPHDCIPIPFVCGKLGSINFPFANNISSKCEGRIPIHGCNETVQKIQFGTRWLEVINISQSSTLYVHDPEIQHQLDSKKCDVSRLTIPPALQYFTTSNTTFFKCNHSLNVTPPKRFSSTECGDHTLFYTPGNNQSRSFEASCPMIQLPVEISRLDPSPKHLLEVLESHYYLTLWDPHDGEFTRNNKLALALGLGIGLPASFVIVLLVCFLYRQRKRKHSTSFYPSKSDPEGGSIYYGVPVFSYAELEKATNKFDHSRELGDGGFGTVYYGKLDDGREVAVKRLYEHNYKRVEQFRNEIEILTRLRHKNLVTLYGCTSRHSRELLLVYEYIPNGTVADHLHGEKAQPGSLTWPTRMSIAIETASALSYLHASDIIHRDVKTNNILLDSNFCVKVADFGLSRLFPNDVTHVSTAPQGTPGYVDPEYHQCYQLTNKSDVYSFGVVLVELISSMPAVDISRHRHEINLSNLAMNKIHKQAYNELVDPTLGFDLDSSTRRMIIMVAELAFRCLQQDKEMRPSMDEVLKALQDIESGKFELDSLDKTQNVDNVESKKNVQAPPSPECDEVGLLKLFRQPSSPISVNAKWISWSSTPNSSV